MSVRWTDVLVIRSFTDESHGQELLCLSVLHPESRFPCYFDERDPKWDQFVEQIIANLPGCVPYDSWSLPPMHPVFELDTNEVYTKTA